MTSFHMAYTARTLSRAGVRARQERSPIYLHGGPPARNATRPQRVRGRALANDSDSDRERGEQWRAAREE